jgi:hypothetical protein
MRYGGIIGSSRQTIAIIKALHRAVVDDRPSNRGRALELISLPAIILALLLFI